MNKMNSQVKLSILILASAIGSAAQAAPAQPLRAELDSLTDPICKIVATRMVQADANRPITDVSPIDVEAVCACAKEDAATDRKINQVLTHSKDLASIQDAGKFRSYVGMRYMAATMKCLSVAFENSLRPIEIAP